MSPESLMCQWGLEGGGGTARYLRDRAQSDNGSGRGTVEGDSGVGIGGAEIKLVEELV